MELIKRRGGEKYEKRVILFLISMLMLSFIGCSQDLAKTALYSIGKDKEECLELADTKLTEDGYGIEYTFKSGSEDEYKLNALLNKDNEVELENMIATNFNEASNEITSDDLDKE